VASRPGSRTLITDSALARAATESVLARPDVDSLTPEQRAPVLAVHPRTNFKKRMIEALSAGVRHEREPAAATFMTDILEATVRPNSCDAILNSRLRRDA
jgi:hypothetical protein